ESGSVKYPVWCITSPARTASAPPRNSCGGALRTVTVSVPVPVGEVNGGDTVGTKAGVQGAIGVVAHDGEIAREGTDAKGFSRGKDHAVGLQYHRLGVELGGQAQGIGEGRGDLAVAAEGKVE